MPSKVKVYEQILQYLAIEGYPTEANPDFREANVSDLVFFHDWSSALFCTEDGTRRTFDEGERDNFSGQ